MEKFTPSNDARLNVRSELGLPQNALLIGLMQGREDARVVTVSSNAHKMGKINFVQHQTGAERGFLAPIAITAEPLPVMPAELAELFEEGN